MPFDWDYVDDNTLIYVDTSADGIKAMVDTALGEALDDVKAEVVDETISTMDIKLEGENLLYKLLVKGDDKGEINIPKDQFLKSASYDKDNKKLIFVMETTDGEKTTEVSISELVEAIEEKNSEQDASLDTKADKTEVDSALETINTKNTEQDAAIEEKAVKAEVDAALALKADKTELEPLAKSADVTAEIAAAVEPLATKEEVNAVDGKLADYATVEALNTEIERATAKENEVTEALNVEAQRATAAESELEGKVTAEQARAEAKEAELVAKDEELDAKKVDWTESDGGRKHIVLKNHDNILGTATDGGTYNLAMVSKWDVADFGSAQLHLNLNSKDAATINDDQVIATENVVDTKIEDAVSAINSKDEAQDAEIALKAVKADVDAALELKADKTELEPLAKSADVTAEIAAAVEPLATKEELTNAAAEAVAKVVAEAPEDFDTLKEVADYIASDKTKATEIENKLSEHDAAVEALNAKDAELNAAIVDEAERATAAESELTGKVVAEQARAEAKEAELVEKDTELAAKDEAQDAEIAKKVDWVESTPGRNHIVLKNHDSVLGTTTDGSTYNLAMVSKWDVADFGSAQLHANLNSKDGNVTINDDKVVATKDEVEAVDAKVNAIDLTPFAKTEDMNAAVEALNAKDAELEAAIPQAAADAVAQVVANAPEDLDTLKEVADYIAADKTKAVEIENKLAELTAKDAELVAKDEAQDAEIALKADKTELEPLATKEEVANVDAKFADYATADALAQVEEKKVDWVESTPDRKHIVLKNHDSILGTATDGSTYNVAMVSKWDVADFGSAQLHLNLNSKDGSVTINDNKNIATEDYVSAAIDGLAKSDDVTAAIATAIEPLATKVEVESAAAAKANAEDVYTKTESDEKFQASGDYVPVEKYNDLKARLDNLEIMMSVYNAEREAQMDEIISNISSDNKEVVTDTLMESIVVPETTVAYTITAPLTDNSTVELTSPKYMTLINTSKEPVSTSIGHTFVEGESTSATSVYLVGDFDTLTLENVSPAVKSGYDAASVNNVVITENNVKNLTLALDIQDGATITNNSNANITIQDKNDLATTLTIVAPNSTVTLNGSNYEVVNATVSDNTLVIKKNVGHIGTLNVSKGNVIVEVARQSLIADKIGEYTLADGYTIDYLHDEIDSTNIANLTKEGTHVLVEDIEKSGNFSVGVLSSDELIWDLNGHSITSSNTRGYGIFTLRGSAKLEINDTVGTGVVKNTADEYGFWTSTVGSKVVINGGHFEASTHVLYAQKGTIEVNGGSFRLTNEDTADKDEFGNFKFLVNCHDEDYVSGDAKIIIRGGKFYGWNPSASYGEPGGPVSFVAEGYGVVESTEMIDGVEHKVFEVKPINE